MTMREWLDSREFYELCQTYRHIGQSRAYYGGPKAISDAFEALKDAIMKQVEGVK